MHRRAVVIAIISGGHIDAVAKEFGVSRASAYNWVRDYNESGAKQLIHAAGDKRFALPGLTPFATLNFIQAAVVRNPTWSADKLSEFLGSMGREIQPRTLRNIFKALGISSACARLSKASTWRQGRYETQEFSEVELVEILSELDGLAPEEVKGRRQGDVLVQDRIKFPKDYCAEPFALELIVDTFAPLKRIYAMVGQPSHSLSVDALSHVEAEYSDQGFKIHKICTPRKQQYSGDLGAVAYPKWFEKHLEQVLDVRPANSKTADSRIKGAWLLLKSEWLKTLPTRLTPGALGLDQIEGDLQVWLAAHRK